MKYMRAFRSNVVAGLILVACGGSGASNGSGGYGYCVGSLGDCVCVANPKAPDGSCHPQDVGMAAFCIAVSGTCECRGIDCYSATSGSCMCGEIPILDANTSKGQSIGPDCQGNFCCLNGTTCSCGPSPCTRGTAVGSCNAQEMVTAFGTARAGPQGKVVSACDATAL